MSKWICRGCMTHLCQENLREWYEVHSRVGMFFSRMLFTNASTQQVNDSRFADFRIVVCDEVTGEGADLLIVMC
jgi:hypothetical protein